MTGEDGSLGERAQVAFPPGEVGRVRSGPLALGRRVLARVLVSPVVVALAVALVYGVWLAGWYASGHSARDFVFAGHQYLEASAASPAISDGPVKATSGTGYDGQFFYYIAMDPQGAAPYLDVPGYRYERIAYPIAARLLVLGVTRRVPVGLVAVNLIGILLGTAAVAAWLRRRGVTPWAAAVWGLLPGQVLSVKHDLSEASAYGVAAVALWLRDRWPLAGGAVFGLAGLTRETTLIFPAVLFLSDLVGLRGCRELRPWLRAVSAALLAALPFLAWKLFLLHWLGSSEEAVTDVFTAIPFSGLLRELQSPELVPAVLVPTLICLGAAAWALWRRLWRVEVALLLVNLAVLVVFGSIHIYEWWPSPMRVQLGAWLAAVLMMAVLPRRGWFWLTAGFWLWLTPAWLMKPF
jgi:hypothetical protein